MSRAFSAGILRYDILSSSAIHPHTMSVTVPGGAVVTIPTAVGASGVVGTITAGNVTATFNDTDVDFPGTWDDSVTAHCHVAAIPGGYRYEWDDSGPQGVPDGDFKDLVMQLRVPTPIIGGSDDTHVRVAVYASDAQTFIANVPRRRNVKWLDEVNASGTGTFEFRLDDDVLADHPDLLDEYNVVKFFVNGKAAKAWIVEDVNVTRVGSGGDADRWVTVAGRGASSILDAAVVYPEYGLRDLVSEDRYFNFASADGVWRVGADWVTPVGIAWINDTTARKSYPKDWPDPVAQWLWSSSPLTNAPVGVNWFRSTFTVSVDTPIVIYATADNQLTLYLDGEVVITSDGSGSSWRTSYTWRTTIAAGTHTLAAKATNEGSTPNPAGYIATIYRTDSSGARTTNNVFRTAMTNTLVKAYGTAPGWNGANILQQLVIEAQNRGVDALLPVTFSFTTSADSYGLPWDDIQDRVVKVGTTDLSDLATQVIELTLDLEIDANFVMNAWKRRGSDLSDSVVIRENRDVTGKAGSIQGSRLRNQALLKFDGGWMELYSAISKSTYGRREVGLSIGTSDSTDQTKLAGQAALREVVSPETTIPVSYTSVKGPQPYLDFNLGDTLMVPDVISGMTKGRLMSISATELGEGNGIAWDLDFYPQVDDSDITTIVQATGGAYNDISALYQHEVLSDSPWGYWRFTEATGTTFGDWSGHKRFMYSTGGPTLAQPGPVQSAMKFGVTTQYTGTDTSHLYAYGPVTLEAWIYVTAFPGSNFSSIIGMANAYGGLYHDKELYIDNSHLLNLRVFTSSSHVLTYGTALATNKWYHIAGSVGTNGMRLYVNGALVASNTAAFTSEASPNKRVFIRGGGSGYNTVEQITIAEPAVYFQQLLDSRLASHFAAAQFTS